MEKKVLGMRLKTYYKIKFPNNTCYIGCSIGPKKRIANHKWMLKYQRHPNPKVQESYNSCKGKNVIYEILFSEKGDKDYHSKREHTLIQETPNTLNIDNGRWTLLDQTVYNKNKTPEQKEIQRKYAIERNRRLREEMVKKRLENEK